jgi:hypothetical protein
MAACEQNTDDHPNGGVGGGEIGGVRIAGRPTLGPRPFADDPRILLASIGSVSEVSTGGKVGSGCGLPDIGRMALGLERSDPVPDELDRGRGRVKPRPARFSLTGATTVALSRVATAESHLDPCLSGRPDRGTRRRRLFPTKRFQGYFFVCCELGSSAAL